MAGPSIFYDMSGRRRRRFGIGVVAFVLLLVIAAAAFAVTILDVVPQRQLSFEVEHGTAASSRAGFLRRTTRKVRQVARSTPLLRGAVSSGKPLAIAFHTPWDDASAASLARHVDELDWVVAGWVSITGPDHHFTLFPDRRGRAVLDRAAHRPTLLPMIQNIIDGEWDGKGMATLLADPAARKTTLDKVEAQLAADRADGAFFDFEDLPEAAQPFYLRFLAEAQARFAKHRWRIAIAVPADDPAWDLPAYAKVADKVFLMAYDEHYQGGEAGPIASQRWFEGVVARAARLVPADRLVVAVASYAYDWQTGGATDALSVEEAWLTARDSGTMPVFDRDSGNSHFAYDEAGKHHEVWIADAASARNQIAALHRMGINSVALWRLGSEDPSFWAIFGSDSPNKLPPASVIQNIPAGTNVDIEGSGEILRIGALPVTGERQVTTDKAGTILDQRFVRLPSPFQVQRTGYKPGLVALTFDDGPDPTWTPRILDVLKEKHVPATFFVIGENGLTERGLLQRELAEGHEVGSHTYTHPNLARTSRSETMLELNATQRLFQAFTGHSLRLFRAPYFGDAEPTTADEIDARRWWARIGGLPVSRPARRSG